MSEEGTEKPYLDVFEFAPGELNRPGMTCLYLYTSAEQLEYILQERGIKLSRTSKTNDTTENVPKGSEHVHPLAHEYGYICLSDTVSSPMMWGQYANNGTGACLVFGVWLSELPFSKNDNAYRLSLTYEDACSISPINPQLIYKIKYTNERCSSDNICELLSTKSKEWEHEHEYRIIVELGNISSKDCIEEHSQSFSYKYLYKRLMPALRRVILGVENKSSVQDMERRVNAKLKREGHEHIRVFKAFINSTRFSIDVPFQSAKKLSPR